MIVLLASVLFALTLGGTLARLTSGPDDDGATALVRGGLWTAAALVAVQEGLGFVGRLGPIATLVVLVVACAAAAAALAAKARAGAPPPRARSGAPWTAFEAGLGAALLVALASRLWQGLHRTTFLYDTLSYHLHAPLTWMHEGRLSIVPAVFGDPAPAYAPSNVELGFLFLMAPVRSDAFARVGQWPLAVLACLAIVATVRQAGGRRAAALAAGLAFLLVPELWQQAATAMVDLGVAAFFLAALPFALRLGREARVGDAAAFGLAVGLCAGSKVVGLVLTLPLVAMVLPALARAGQTRSRAALAALAAAVATGGTWYARNLVVTGNPLYPATLRLGGRTVFSGLYDGALMRASDYHVPVTDVAALGRLLLEAGVGMAVGGALALALGRRTTWALLAAALVASFWLVLPYQESRFLFALWGVLCVAMAAPTRGQPPALAWAPLAFATIGSVVEFPTAERWTVLAAGALVPLCCLSGLSIGRPRALRAPRAVAVFAIFGILGCLGAIAALAVTFREHERHPPAYSVGDGLDGAWAWMRAHVRGARVAYTGNNLPFPLAGAQLANDVRYVNVAGAPDDLAHDFTRRAPVAATTAEPAPYRQGARYETWRANLAAMRRELLFVAASYPGVRRTIPCDPDGFPIERAWADAHPETFSLRFASEAARIYAVAAP